MNTMSTKSRVAGVFIGLAVGDALGVPLEKREFGYGNSVTVE